MDINARAQKIKLLVFDVDGVLTNNQIIFGPDGEAMKIFNSQDGLGMAAAGKMGLKTAIITGRESEMVRRRCRELGVTDIRQGSMDKAAHLAELAAKHGLAYEEIGYAGDDLNDLAVLKQVGLACAVANAVPEVKAAAHYITAREGGRGAVREIVELVLKAQGKWDALVAMYANPGKVETRQ
ncbi:MAG: HAD hydrolase family protein [Negativicutes bacterium]|nr:HAD hydrolase family protein [Negativicutes bacterium]